MHRTGRDGPACVYGTPQLKRWRMEEGFAGTHLVRQRLGGAHGEKVGPGGTAPQRT
jgi:hypothetical protein